jgi:hypothetical protein
MTIQDTINTDQAALNAATAKLAADTIADQAAIDSAAAQLADDQAKLAAIQPHLAMLAQLKSDFVAAEAGLDPTAQGVAATFQPILDQFIANMTAALLG